MFSVEGKKVFITGGSSGIGRAIAEVFVENKADVVIVDICDASEIAKEIGARFIQSDVSDETSVKQSFILAESLFDSSLDIVILNAGIGEVGPTIEKTDHSLLELMTKINQWGVFYGLKYAPKHMNDGGSIITTSSMGGLICMPGTGVYSAGKRALISLTEMSALELGSRNIRVNAVCPGYVDTALGNTPEEKKIAQTFTALGRHASPKDDIAGVYLFLGSPASQYITGQALQVDGGWGAGPTEELLEVVTGSSKAPGS